MTMAVRTPQENSHLNRMLQSHGLGKLDEAGMIPALGFLVQDHEHLRSLLARCEPEKRADMYNCLAANTRFPAHPLDWYMAQTAEKAANQHQPTLEPDGSYKFDPTVTPEFGDIPEASVSPAAGALFIAAAIGKVKDIQGVERRRISKRLIAELALGLLGAEGDGRGGLGAVLAGPVHQRRAALGAVAGALRILLTASGAVDAGDISA